MLAGPFRTPIVVLDTNVAVPGLIGYRRVPRSEAVSSACILAAREGRARLAASPELFEEVLDVLQRAPFRLSYRTARRHVAILERGTRVVAATGRVRVLRLDPDDNMILETAIAARADFLVTWNLVHYEELGRNEAGRLVYRGVEVLPPGEFLRVLRDQAATVW